GCTVWIIDDVNHCFISAGHCTGASFDIVEFNVPLSSAGGTAQHPPPEDQYAVDPVSLQFTDGGIGNDWAYFGCFPNANTGLTPFQAQGAFYTLAAAAPAVAGQTIRITGYGVTSSPISPTWNLIQKTHTGPYVLQSGTTIRYAVDTTGGNSGSAVFNETTGEAIGVHTNAGCNSVGGNQGTAVHNVGWQNALANPQGVCVPMLPFFVFPNGRPSQLNPAGGTTIRVEVVDQGGDLPDPGTGMLHFDDGMGFTAIPMVEVTPNVYDAVFPAFGCGTVVDYYFSAQTIPGTPIFDPNDAPLVTYEAISADGLISFAFDFETAPGWTVENVSLTDGAWDRGIPVGGGDRFDPPTDFDGSGQCFLTDNVDGNSDVDGGPTRLISPAFDLTAATDPSLSYARWFYNDDNDADRLDVELSDDDGTSWVLVESVPSASGWFEQSVQITNFVNLTATVRVRFSATDNPNNSLTEAGVDKFAIVEVECAAAPCTKGDVNVDGLIDGDDIVGFSRVLIEGSAADPAEFCAVDMDDDGFLEPVDDVNLFVTCLLTGPCP
ncbi:MAG: trypsin-like peptidase domain-containing protein, partial [Phycisphaerae bacterium]